MAVMAASQSRSTQVRRSWWRKNWVPVVVLSILIPVGFVLLVPVLWMLTVSLQPLSEAESFPPHLIPHPVMFSNYIKALTFEPFGQYFLNTFFISFMVLIGSLSSSSIVAYAFARLKAPGKTFLFMLVLSTLVLPYTVTLVPQYVMFKYFGWINTYLPLIVPSFFGNAFFIFLFRQFFATIPEEVFEAARLDGCGYLGAFWRIMVPLSLPVMATAAIFSFQGTWQDYLGPLVYINSANLFTVSLGLANFTANYGATPWNLLMAASLVAILPPVLIFFFAQRQIISGIVVTAK